MVNEWTLLFHPEKHLFYLRTKITAQRTHTLSFLFFQRIYTPLQNLHALFLRKTYLGDGALRRPV